MRPQPAARMEKHRDELFGVKVRDVSYMDRVVRRWPEKQRGVLVVEVPAGGWTALAGLAGGDLILRLNRAAVGSVVDFRKVMKRISAERPKHVVLYIKRGIYTRFIEIEPAWPDA